MHMVGRSCTIGICLSQASKAYPLATSDLAMRPAHHTLPQLFLDKAATLRHPLSSATHLALGCGLLRRRPLPSAVAHGMATPRSRHGQAPKTCSTFEYAALRHHFRCWLVLMHDLRQRRCLRPRLQGVFPHSVWPGPVDLRAATFLRAGHVAELRAGLASVPGFACAVVEARSRSAM